jgi:hypothetical protein
MKNTQYVWSQNLSFHYGLVPCPLPYQVHLKVVGLCETMCLFRVKYLCNSQDSDMEMEGMWD